MSQIKNKEENRGRRKLQDDDLKSPVTLYIKKSEIELMGGRLPFIDILTEHAMSLIKAKENDRK